MAGSRLADRAVVLNAGRLSLMGSRATCSSYPIYQIGDWNSRRQPRWHSVSVGFSQFLVKAS
jgi:hypothetical protein